MNKKMIALCLSCVLLLGLTLTGWHVLQGQAIAGQIISQGAVQAGELILSPDTKHGEYGAVGFKAHDLGRGAANINS